MPDVEITRDGPVGVPLSYTVPSGGELAPLNVEATLDGTSALVPFYAVLQVLDPNGHSMGKYISSSIVAGGSADVTWFRGVGSTAAASGGSGDFTVQTFTTAGTFTWTKPNLVTICQIYVIGAGGGGGGGLDNVGSGAAGGGGGAVSIATFLATSLPGSLTVTVGAGGAGGVHNTQLGVAGGTSSFGTLVLAGGGSGGRTDDTSWGGGTVQGGAGGTPLPSGLSAVGIGGQGTEQGRASEFGGAGGGQWGPTNVSGTNAGDSIWGGPGGGGGGGTSTGAALDKGGNGGGNMAYLTGSGALGGQTAGAAGANGATGPNPYCGQGGGGGAGAPNSAGTPGGAGGNGGIGAGGGGGGGGQSGANGGAGGKGGDGRLIVVSW